MSDRSQSEPSQARETEKLVYTTYTVDLSVSNTDAEQVLPGIFDNIAVITLTGQASIRLNKKTRDLIDLSVVRSVAGGPFDRFFITNAAQVNAILVLALGGDASFRVDATPTENKDFVSTVAGQASTAAYVDILTSTYTGDAQKMLIFVGESGGVNGVTFQVYGSSIASTWQAIGAPAVVPLSQTAAIVITDAWRYIKVQVIDTVGGNHGTAFASLHKLRA